MFFYCYLIIARNIAVEILDNEQTLHTVFKLHGLQFYNPYRFRILLVQQQSKPFSFLTNHQQSAT